MCMNLSAKVYNYIIEGVINDRYQPGEKIPERKIASELNISHVPVREALERLFREGWIIRIPRRGAFVKEITPEDVVEMSQIREILESGAAKLITRNLSDETLREFKTLADELEKASDEGNPEMYEKLDREFHRKIVDLVNNKTLSNFYETIILKNQNFCLKEAIKISFSWNENLERLNASTHKRIYKALAARNPDKAARMVMEHIHGGETIMKKVAEMRTELRKQSKK